MRIITLLLLMAALAGCLTGDGPEESDAQNPNPNLVGEPHAPHQSVVVFDEIVETFPGLDQSDTWTFMIENKTDKFYLDMVELEGATIGDFSFVVLDPSGNETIMLDALGVRVGTSGYTSGSTQNGRAWQDPTPGTWTIRVDSDGRFQQHVIVTASVPEDNLNTVIVPASFDGAALLTPQDSRSAASSPLYDGVIEAGPGVSTLATEKFTVGNSYDSLRVSIVPLEGLSVGSWELKVRSPGGEEWTVLEESGLRFGQATAVGGETTNNGMSIVAEKGEILEHGEWRLRVETTGFFQLHVVVTAE